MTATQAVGDFPVNVMMNQFDLSDWNHDDDSDLSSFVIPDESIDFINSLTAIGGHDRQYFNELRSTVVSRRIFIRSQSMMAR